MVGIPLKHLPSYNLPMLYTQRYTSFINYRNSGYSIGLSTKLQNDYMTYPRTYMIYKLKESRYPAGVPIKLQNVLCHILNYTPFIQYKQ